MSEIVPRMKQFDVVVVGGGPAGAHCARLLAKACRKVLLVERHKNFVMNNHSAGTPLETLGRYQLPERIIGSYWDEFVVVTSHQSGRWQARSPFGVMLDFAKLREFLADDVREHGGEVWMNCRYVRHEQRSGETMVSLVREGQEEVVGTRVLVDATGPLRSVIHTKGGPQPELLIGTGVDYVIEVEDADYQRYANVLTYFLGHKWMPRGYCGIFAMAPNQLRVGSGRWAYRCRPASSPRVDHAGAENTKPLRHHIQKVIDDYMQLKVYRLVEVHGGAVKYSSGLNDVYHRNNVIAIGDAVSTVNFLGGEGIRHGLEGAVIACKYIQTYLDHTIPDFKPYRAEMHKVFRRSWNLSETFGKKLYLQDCDDLVDEIVTSLRHLSLEDVVDIVFYYRFEKFSKDLPQYILRKLDSLWTRLMCKLKNPLR